MNLKLIGKGAFYSFIPVSILTGLTTIIGELLHQEKTFYYLHHFGQQLSELLLLIVIACGYKPLLKIIWALVALCGAEMWDETLGRNFNFNIYDFVLIVVIFIYVLSCLPHFNKRVE